MVRGGRHLAPRRPEPVAGPFPQPHQHLSVMKRPLFTLTLLSGVLIGFAVQHPSPTPPPEFEVPEGFAVERVIGPDVSGSLVAMTFDSEGRIVASREDTSIVTFMDPEGDGTYEERVFTNRVVEGQGILFDGSDLLTVGNGPEGVGMYRISDEDGDSRGDAIDLVEPIIGEMGDHGPHQPYFGPDGYLYWSIGNFAAIEEAVAPLSPLRDYADANLEVARTNGFGADTRAPGSVVLRRDLERPDSDWEMVAGGMRNHYDGAFNAMGELFTFDSDMEWDRGLPWYRENRSVHLAPGGDFGWRSGNMKHPAYYIDDLPPMEDVGRGSPTGVTFYQSYQYPARYWDMFLQGDWSRGRILMGHLTRDGASYSQDSSENFVFGTPLNVVDVEVGPDGHVYFAMGGRDTEGGIYRVVYEGENAMNRPEVDGPIDEALTMPQPRSTYSRHRIREIADEVGEQEWGPRLRSVAAGREIAPARRVRALELLQVFGPGLEESMLRPLIQDPSWKVRAAAAYYLGMKKTPSARETLAGLLDDSEPFVQRRAAEALLRTGVHPAMDVPFSAEEDVMPLLANEDRFVRYAGRALIRELNRTDWQEAALAADEFPQAPEALLAFVQSMESPYMKDLERVVERSLELLRTDPSNEELLPLLRTMERVMIDDHGVRFGEAFFSFGEEEGPPGGYAGIGQELKERFPSDDWRVNREIARILAYLEPDSTAPEIVAALEDTTLGCQQQIAYADALSFVESTWDSTSIDRMTSWYEKVYSEEWRGGRQFVSYINLMESDFLDHIPYEQRQVAFERIDAAKPRQDQGEGFAAQLGLSPVSEAELEEELIFDPEAHQGDPAAGVVAYENAQCLQCHTFGPIGQEVGPDLTTINQRFNREDLVTSILRPSETISDLWQSETITRTDGQTVTGMVMSENADQVNVQIPLGPQMTIPKSEIESREVSEQSGMPANLLSLLDDQERIDLLLLLEAGPEAVPDSALARLNDQ